MQGQKEVHVLGSRGTDSLAAVMKVFNILPMKTWNLENK